MKITLFLFTATMILITLLGVTALAPTTRAGTDENFGDRVKIWDDQDLYLAMVSQYFELGDQDVRKWNSQCRDSSDLSVALFLADRTGRTPTFILTLRREGASWWDIGQGLGLKADTWFLPVDETPAAPFGTIYQAREAAELPTLSDADCRNLAAARFLYEYFGVTVETSMTWIVPGRSLQSRAADEYRNRHVRGTSLPADEPVNESVSHQDEPTSGHAPSGK